MGTILLAVCYYVSHEEFLGGNAAATRHLLSDLFVPGTFPPDPQGCRGHAWMVMFWAGHDALAPQRELRFWITYHSQSAFDCSILVCQCWSYVKDQDSVKTEWFYFSEQYNYFPNCKLWVSSANHELWPVFYSWFNLLSWILPLASKTCKTGSTALRQRWTSLWVWVLGSHLFQGNVSILHRILSPWAFLISHFMLAQV